MKVKDIMAVLKGWCCRWAFSGRYTCRWLSVGEILRLADWLVADDSVRDTRTFMWAFRWVYSGRDNLQMGLLDRLSVGEILGISGWLDFQP
jgi:hypothetical protein